jgi:hypothetical protein
MHPKKIDFVKSSHPNMARWVEEDTLLNTDMYKESWCNTVYGGRFSVSKEQIHNMPKRVYQDLKGKQKHANAEIDHFIERTWATLFCANSKAI